MERRKAAREGAGGPPTRPEVAPGALVAVVVEVTRGGSVERHRVRVASGTLVRAVVRRAGCAPEGSAVLIDGTSVPLDAPIDRPVRLTVVPTFSGG